MTAIELPPIATLPVGEPVLGSPSRSAWRLTGGSVVPFSRPDFGYRERLALWRATASVSATGAYKALTRFEEKIAARTGAGAALATSSGTTALYVALRVLRVEAGDEVLVPMLAPPDIVAPLLWMGARPVLVDVDPRTLTIDPARVAERLRAGAANGRLPRAVIAVDLYGHPCDYAALSAVCARHQVPVIEDASHALGGSCNQRPLGALGTIGVLSFSANKIVSTGAGGALVTNRRSLLASARTVLGESEDPVAAQWGLAGCRLNPLVAPLGCGQLDRLDRLVAERRRMAALYDRRLADVGGVRVLGDALWGRSSRWVITVDICPDVYGTSAPTLADTLRAGGVEARAVTRPLQQYAELALSERVGGEHAEQASRRTLCLPSGARLSLKEQERIIKILRNGRPAR